MNYFLFVLSFVAGAAVVFLYYKKRLNEWRDQLNYKIEELKKINTKEIKHEQHDHQNETLQSENLEGFKKTIDNLYIVNELGRKVTSSLNLQQTFKHLYTTINSMMDAAVLELSVHDEISGTSKVFSNSESNEASYTNHMSEWCFNNNREVFLTDAENDFARYVFEPLVLPDGRKAKSVIIFPIINRDIVSGTLCVISFQKNSFGDYHREIIRLLLGYISVAIENALRHEELNRTKIRAEQSEKFKEQFLANMSHEIRTPINAVTGMTRLLLEKQPRQDQLRYLESIRNASDSLLVIINDILDLSKIEAGKIELEQIDFSVADLIKNVKEIMHFKSEEKGLAFEEQIDGKIPAVLVGDPTRLTQILINLVGNAIKFTSKGSVKIIATAENSGEMKSSIRFEISDTGIGMTQEQQRKLFQNYSQASSETSRKYGGTGLGLSISRQLVNLQGGNIDVKSVPGKGSTFSFILSFPVSKNKIISSREKSVSKEMLQELNGIRILLADDNEYNRIVVRETLQLKLKDIQIDEAVDGSIALDMIKKNDYDIVLMDLVMPEIDGLEATKIIRKEMTSPKNEIQILALTASVVKSEIEKCYSAGMNGFIPKPFKSYELFGAIYKALNKEKEIIFEDIVVNNHSDKPHGEYVDLNYLYEFTEGDEIRIKKYIDLFLTKTPINIETIKSALKNNDYEMIRVTVHSMKPQLQAAGVKKGLAIAETIEQNCNEKLNLDRLGLLIEKLDEVCTNAIAEMNVFCKEL